MLELKEKLTSRRDQLDQYKTSARLISAYTLFYLPTNFYKFSFLWRHLSPSVKEEFKEVDFIDLGTGPSTFILSFLHWVGEGFSGRMVGLDSAPLMLEQARKCLATFYPSREKDILFSSTLPDSFLQDPTRKRVLFFGHSLNEMGVEAGWNWIKRVKPAYVIFIEPGTPAAFQMMLEIRRRMRQAGFTVHFPCPSLSAACPVEGKAEAEEDWCHQKMYQSYPPDLDRLGQLLSINRHSMPLILHVYGPPLQGGTSVAVPEEGVFHGRLFRLLRESKFSFLWEICREDSGELKILKIEIFKRNLKREKIKALKAAVPGEWLTLSVEKVLSPDFWRVVLR